MPAEPEDFGILALYPGILGDSPGFSFYRTGAVGILEHYIQSATGIPRLLYTLAPAVQAPLDSISGNSNSYFFGAGRMTFGNGDILASGGYSRPFGTGVLNVHCDGRNASASYGGLTVYDTKSATTEGNPITILRKRAAGAGSTPLEVTSFIGINARLKAGLGAFTTGKPLQALMHYTAITEYSDDEAKTPKVGTAAGFAWGKWNGTDFYSVLGAHPNYTEVGYFPVSSQAQNLSGGKGGLVLRDCVQSFQDVTHPDGTILYSDPADKTFHVINSEGKNVTLSPGISGVDRIAHSAGYYVTATFDVGVSGVPIGPEHDGKKVLISTQIADPVPIIIGAVGNGFSCEIFYIDNTEFLFTSTALVYQSSPHPPGQFGTSKVEMILGDVHVTHSVNSEEIFLNPEDFYTATNLPATRGEYISPVYSDAYATWEFSPTAPQAIHASFNLPPGWRSIRVFGIFLITSGTTSSLAKFFLETKLTLMNEPVDTAYSDPSLVDVVYGGTAAPISKNFGKIVPPGVAYGAPSQMCRIRLIRDATNAGDTLTSSVKFLGVRVLKGS